MIKSSIEKLAEEIGFDIGNSDDETQSKLINGFCRAINNSMQKDEREKQICYICDKLTNGSHFVIKVMYEFIKLKEQDNE